MWRLISIAIAAIVSFFIGKSIGEDEGFRKKIIAELRVKCPPEFRDRVRYAKCVRERGENQVTAELRDIKHNVLCRVDVKEEGICKVFKENQCLYI